MNIFYLDSDPTRAAQYHCDKHVVKMILETAQLLSTAHHVLDGKRDDLYKATHVNHPSSIWVRTSDSNYWWTYVLFNALCGEYTYRYDKIHATETKLAYPLITPPKHLPKGMMTAIPQCMPDEFKEQHDPITAYRRYYNSKQEQFTMKWTGRRAPAWFHPKELDD